MESPTPELDVSSIAPPKQPPPDTPDSNSTGEMEYLERAEAMAKMTPTARHLAVHEHLVSYLKTQCSTSQYRANSLQGELDKLRPAYSSLHQQSKNSSWYTVIATIAMAFGAVLVGDPDRISWFSQASTVGCGWGFLGLGCLLLVSSCWLGWPPSEH